MNCKQGDLAIVIKSYNNVNLGKIVRCVKFVAGVRLLGENPKDVEVSDAWKVEGNLISPFTGTSFNRKGSRCNMVKDTHLKPIRGLDEDDVVSEYKELVAQL